LSVADRLRQERERLGLTQTEFGALDDASKSTVQAWERGTAYPNARFLAAAAAAGLDVRWVVTGERDYAAPPAMTADEAALLAVFRVASREVRDAALRVLGGERPKAGPRIKVGGNVNQFNAGDHTTNVLTTSGEKPRHVLQETRKKPGP
jgi:transcriptional regulator with XRE-family HTH domain